MLLTLPFCSICGYRRKRKSGVFYAGRSQQKCIVESIFLSTVGGTSLELERIPPTKAERERLRALSADIVASWSCEGLPAEIKQHNGLRLKAQELVSRAKADPSFVGWTMVTILSEVWRYRIASAAAGQRLLLLPDLPSRREPVKDKNCPSVCGPSCGLGTFGPQLMTTDGLLILREVLPRRLAA